MIRIICGTCETALGYKTRADGELTLPAAQEKRLVERGVAEYVMRPVINPASDADSPVDGGDGGGAGIDPPDEDLPAEDVESGGRATTGYLDVVDGHFTVESLMLLSKTELEKLAADMGVNVKKGQNKGQIAALLAEVEVETETPAESSGEAPPELGAEAPVV